jgi:hypothetical protein
MADVAGRPTKYEPERVERILKAIRDGLPFVTAAAIGGISQTTFYQWQKDYPEFSDNIKEAEAVGEEELLASIRTDSTWQSKAWILERRHPDRWGRREQIKQEISGDGGGPVVLAVLKGVKLEDL